MTVSNYSDVLSTMKKFQPAPNQACSRSLRVKNSNKIRPLASTFIKVEDQSRKFRPQFAEIKSFPFIDFNTVGTFDT